MNIENKEEVVLNYTLSGLRESGNMELALVAISGGKFLHAEQECNKTQKNGVAVTAVIKEHLTATFNCMNDTSRVLQETDRQAAINSAGITSWADKIFKK